MPSIFIIAAEKFKLSYSDDFDLVIFLSRQCEKLNFWQKSLLYRILKNLNKLTNYF